jgi:hypothetical protein
MPKFCACKIVLVAERSRQHAHIISQSSFPAILFNQEAEVTPRCQTVRE